MPRSGFAALSPRQKDCLRLTAQLKGSKEIALELGLSQKTVDTHIAAAIRTLDAPNRRHAARLFSQYCAGEAQDKLLRQTSRLADLPTSQSLFPSQTESENAAPKTFQEPGHGQEPLPPWNINGARLRDFFEGITPDDLRPSHRAGLIIAGAIVIALALATTITFVDVLSRMTDQSIVPH